MPAMPSIIHHHERPARPAGEILRRLLPLFGAAKAAARMDRPAEGQAGEIKITPTGGFEPGDFLVILDERDQQGGGRARVVRSADGTLAVERDRRPRRERRKPGI